MTDSYWISGSDGNWDDPDNWSNGVPDGPTSSADLEGLTGVTVTLSTAHTIDNLSIGDGSGSVLNETATGSLHVGEVMYLHDGADVILADANTNESGAYTQLVGSRLDVRNDQALGTMRLLVDQGAALTSHGVVTISNDVDFGNVGASQAISAGAGGSLALTGDLSFTGYGALVVGEANAAGTVILAPSSLAIDDGILRDRSLEVAFGTLRVESGAGAGLFTDSADVQFTTSVDKGAVLDIDGQNLEISNLAANISYPIDVADGRITNSGAVSTLTIDAGAFGGMIDGDLNVVLSGDVDLYGSLNPSGHVTVSGTTNLFTSGKLSAPVAVDGALQYQGPFTGAPGALTITGDISGTGRIVQSSGSDLILKHANDFTGQFVLKAGVTTMASAAALGTGEIYLEGGALLSTVNATASNGIFVIGGGTIAAAHGKILTLSGELANAGVGVVGALTFGAAGDDGVIVDNMYVGTVLDLGVTIAAGTLRIGPGADGGGFQRDVFTKLMPGATLDLYGNHFDIANLSGGGALTNTRPAAASLVLIGGSFDGVISGNLSLEIGYGNATTLTNAETFTGGVTIDHGDVLQLGKGGTGGLVLGAIVDYGRLALDHSNAITLANAISGSGDLVQRGAGATTLTGANAFSGGVIVKAGQLIVADGSELGTGDVRLKGGVLAIGDGSPLGSGDVTLSGGELLAQATLTLGGTFTLQGASTIAAAHGTTLTLGGDQQAGATTVLHFGDATNDGTVVLAPASVEADHGLTIDVDHGTLRLGNPVSGTLVGSAGLLNVAGGASFDVGGQVIGFDDLTGAGRVTDTGAAGYLIVDAATFSGQVSGPLTVVVETSATLSGPGAFTELQIAVGASTTLASTAAEKVTFQGGGAALILAPSANLTGHIEGLASGTTIDVERVAFGKSEKLTYAPNIGKLVLSDNGQSATLHFDGSYGKSEFSLSDDGHGGTLISFKAPAGSGQPGADAGLIESHADLGHHHAHADFGLVV